MPWPIQNLQALVNCCGDQLTNSEASSLDEELYVNDNKQCRTEFGRETSAE